MSKNLMVFQSYLSEDEKKLISPACIPLNIDDNTQVNQREYNLFKKIATTQDSRVAWGLISSKFEHKSLITPKEFCSFAEDKMMQGYDCIFINPMIGNEALHLNVWEQGICSGHAGLEKLFHFLSKNIKEIQGAPMNNDTFSLCNYFVGNANFWNAYFKFIDHVLNLIKDEGRKNSEISSIFGGSGAYVRDATVTMEPFLIERLFSSFIQNSSLKKASFKYDLTHYQKKFGQLYGNLLYSLSGLKNVAIQLKHPGLMGLYDEIRLPILRSSMMHSIASLDDPPSFFLSDQFHNLTSIDFKSLLTKD